MNAHYDTLPPDEWSDPVWLSQHPGASPQQLRRRLYAFPTWADAHKFGDRLALNALGVQYGDYAGDIELPWNVTVLATAEQAQALDGAAATLDRLAMLTGGRRLR
ncbi:MAG TPA: hypothetical protein VHE37_04840 [Nevskiaceae bacterium]|nr:hypothetical protein [Nevskiaceae bacterium]